MSGSTESKKPGSPLLVGVGIAHSPPPLKAARIRAISQRRGHFTWNLISRETAKPLFPYAEPAEDLIQHVFDVDPPSDPADGVCSAPDVLRAQFYSLRAARQK